MALAPSIVNVYCKSKVYVDWPAGPGQTLLRGSTSVAAAVAVGVAAAVDVEVAAEVADHSKGTDATRSAVTEVGNGIFFSDTTLSIARH